MNKEKIKDYIQMRTTSGLSTRPENIIKELRIKPEYIQEELQELHRKKEIYLDAMGWKAS